MEKLRMACASLAHAPFTMFIDRCRARRPYGPSGYRMACASLAHAPFTMLIE